MALSMSADNCTILSTIYENCNLNYLLENHQVVFWAIFFLSPVAITFLSISILYVVAIFMVAYQFVFKIFGYQSIPWNGARYVGAYTLNVCANIWHGYEIEGLENIPSEGPVLIVFYHGTLPVDGFFFIAKCFLLRKRMSFAVADRFLFKFPAFQTLSDCFQVTKGSPETCAEILSNGNPLIIYPGGAREGYFSDENYGLIWEKRVGFARRALEAKAPIIPVFTKNIQQAYFIPRLARKYLRGLYEKTRLPVLPICGGFPVKLRTIVGEAIPHDPDVTPEKLTKIVSTRLEALIARHQQIPGSIRQGLLERIPYFPKSNLK